jgi:hypothetical protein
MPRLSLYKPERGNDFKFIDRQASEMFQAGGTDLYLHKYLGPATKTSGTADQPVYATQNVANIQDLLFLENRDRAYDSEIYRVRGIYNVSNIDFNLSQFRILVNNGAISVWKGLHLWHWLRVGLRHWLLLLTVHIHCDISWLILVPSRRLGNRLVPVADDHAILVVVLEVPSSSCIHLLLALSPLCLHGNTAHHDQTAEGEPYKETPELIRCLVAALSVVIVIPLGTSIASLRTSIVIASTSHFYT